MMSSIWRNSVGLPLVERNHDYNQNADMVEKFRIAENYVCRNNEDVTELGTDIIENRAIQPPTQKQQWHQPQLQAPPPKRQAIHWENFLSVRSLKVLLVESDDSTRYTVSALLRNCSYEVTAVSNGLEAWETLKDVTNHVDLVLTEVAMPCLSGIDLLSKIMSDKTCKNIPVIMMSSNDSMSIVFKCLSNGAVDFLVKPIRKNELKNLWQHVWRKCHGSGGGSGSGSESGIQTQNSSKSKSADGSNNDTDLNYEEGNGSTGLTVRNGSDNDSGTQSACSTRALEVHSSQPISQCDDRANLLDSTCAHVIHSRSEEQGSNWVSANATTIIQNEGNEHDDVAMGKDLTLGSPTPSELQFRNPSDEVLAKVSSSGVSKFLDLDIKKDEKKQGKEIVEDNTVTENSDIKRKDNNDPTISITNVTLSCGEIARNELVSDPSKVRHVESCDDGKEPSLELSLQWLRDVGSSSRTNDQMRNILRHSDHSAFSRYNATLTNKQICSSVTRSLEARNIESMQHLQREINGTQNQGSNGSSNNFDMGSTSNCVSDLHCEMRITPNQGSKGSSNNCDIGSTSNRVSDKPESVVDKPISVHNCHAFQPVQHVHCPSGQTGISDTAKTVTTTQGMAMHQTPQIEHHHYHHHNHHHHVRGLQQQQMSLDSDDLSSGNIIDAAPHCGMSDKLGMGIEGNAANFESASGSNNGSNGLNGRNNIVGGTDVAADNNTPGACVAVSGNKSAVEHDRLALREAALIKFRKKRKDRCFEKKVRYQSRKMLAEQRPRVRGQFVRQTLDVNKCF